MSSPISFSLDGWREAPPGPDPKLVWHNDHGDSLSFIHFLLPPDIPVPLESEEKVREFYCRTIQGSGAGMVEFSIFDADGVPGVRMIIKHAQKPAGYTYLGSITVPRQRFSLVLKIQCAEAPPTGIREAVVMDRLLGSGGETDRKGFPAGWLRHPYDPSITTGVLRSRAEDEEYDADFPDHPLSRLRRAMREIEGSLRVSDEVRASAPFMGTPPGARVLMPPRQKPWWKFW